MKNMIVEQVRMKAAGCLLAAVASLAVFSLAHAGPEFNNPADVKAISDIEHYINLQTDMKNVISYYGPDAIIYDIPAPGIYHGTKQIYDGFEPQLATLVSIKLGIPEINIVSDGTMACSAMQLHYNVVLKSGGAASYQYREIDVFRKIHGKWEIVQSHLSFPANVKTGMVVMNGPVHLVGPFDWGTNAIQTPAMDPAQAKAEITNWMVVDAHTTSVDHLETLYGPDDNTSTYDVFYPGDLHGLQQTENYYRPFFEQYKTNKVDITQSYVDSDGVLGAVIDQQNMDLTAKDGSKKFIAFRQSDCLRRVNGKWYSFFEMTSFPADLKTGKSVMEGSAASQH